MKRSILFVSVLAFSVSVLVVACNSGQGSSTPSTKEEPEALSRDGLVKKGEYLVTIMGCNDCHTPKKMGPKGPELDEDRLFCGHPADVPLAEVDTKALSSWVLFNHLQTATVGPWGVSFAANISSDPTGIGNWTEQQFFRAMREGKYKGLENARQLLPPMPWPSYAKLTDEDLRAIFSYLKASKPVRNIVPAPIPPDQLAAVKK